MTRSGRGVLVRSPLVALTFALAMGSLQCTVVGGGPSPAGTFVAHQADFEGFLSWTHYALGDAPIAGHPAGSRVVYINHLLAPGETTYPVGTVIVKVIQTEAAMQAWDIFAMAKRGGGYNAGGADGWEFFRLVFNNENEPLILARGIDPTTGDQYGNVSGGGCNACHSTASAAGHDSILDPYLIPGGLGHTDGGVCSTLADGGVSAPPADASALDASVDGGLPSTDGTIRFINLSQSSPTVRFVAASQPGYIPATVVAVVSQGMWTPLTPTPALAYDIDVFRSAGSTPEVDTDGGMGDGATSTVADVPGDLADPNPVGNVAARIRADVPAGGGVTIVLAGAADGSAANMTDVRLWQITDITPTPDLQGVGLVRVVSFMVGTPTVTVVDSTFNLATNVSFGQPTGFVPECADAHLYNVTDASGTVLGSTLTGEVVDGHPHTAYVWGDTSLAAGFSAHITFTDDLPPGR